MRELAPGELLGPYLLADELGRGGMGIVYRAERPGIGTVALKVLRPELSADETYRRRFEREGRIAAELEHPHLVPVVDAGVLDGRHYLAVRYVEGGSLAQRLERERALPRESVLRLAGELGAALDALHGRELVHRDVKPANVMLDQAGSAALTDFGLAKGAAHTVLTRPGELMGTVDYLAPELIRGAPASPASDVYALGCVLYECLAGRPPFAHAKGLVATGLAILGEAPPPLRDAPPSLARAVAAALEKDPARRPRSAGALAV
jgi:serine/threonine protein kinase